MIRKPLLILLAGWLAAAPNLFSQTPADPAEGAEKPRTSETSGPARFWQASLPGGSFMVALDKISSISRAKYLLDGAFIVDEVTIDTAGQALARFYFITPVTEAAPGNTLSDLTKRGRELAEKAGERTQTGDLQNMVVKKYPDTTHAKSIEYRLSSEADLTALHTSVKTCWETGRGRQFTAK